MPELFDVIAAGDIIVRDPVISANVVTAQVLFKLTVPSGNYVVLLFEYEPIPVVYSESVINSQYVMHTPNM